MVKSKDIKSSNPFYNPIKSLVHGMKLLEEIGDLPYVFEKSTTLRQDVNDLAKKVLDDLSLARQYLGLLEKPKNGLANDLEKSLEINEEFKSKLAQYINPAFTLLKKELTDFRIELLKSYHKLKTYIEQKEKKPK